MLLISIDVEYNYNLIEKIRKAKDKVQTNIFISDDLNYSHDYSNYDYIITEYDIKKIDYFSALGKNVIICCFNDETIESSYRKKENITICYTEDDVVKKVCEKPLKKDSYITWSYLKKALPALLIILIAVFGVFTLSKTVFKPEPKEEKKQQKVVEKKSTEIDFGKENYVFLGDSITDFYDLETYYGDLPVVNSGISGNQYKDLLNNLETRVYAYNPTKIFILIGTNDIAFTDITDEELVDKIIEICDEIHKVKEKAEIYVESIYPVNKTTNNDIVDLDMVTVRENDRIKEINKLLKEKVEENKYNYINMYDLLKDEDDNLKLDYTVDGLHISDQGYKVITKKIKEIIYNKEN